MDKLHFIKIKYSGSLQDLVEKMKIQDTAWEKILTNHTHDKGYVSRIYKEIS